jgi:intraflagellar transport protein 52
MKPTILDAGRHELYSRDKKLSHLASLISPLCEVRTYKGPLTAELFNDASSIWFAGPRRDLKPEELPVLDAFIQGGGACVIFADSLPPILLQLITKYGVSFSDPVIAPTYIRYVDPHQVTVQQGIVNRAVAQFSQEASPTFAFPMGCTLDISAPSVPMLTSGLSSYPLNRPIIAHGAVGAGSLTVFGSPHIFCDDWIKSESNEKLAKFVIGLLLSKTEQLNPIDAEHPEVTERWYTPDIQSMSDRLRSCIQESENLRPDFRENFERGMFRMDLSFVAQAEKVAQVLGIKNEPLATVKPQFDTALPALTPAVFPPQMREPSGPVLELFDLDDSFASPKTRLAQLAQRTPPKNAEKFIIQSAKILGIFPQLPEAKRSAKDVLEYVFTQVVKWKRGAG